jgi:hypothetical protein
VGFSPCIDNDLLVRIKKSKIRLNSGVELIMMHGTGFGCCEWTWIELADNSGAREMLHKKIFLLKNRCQC